MIHEFGTKQAASYLGWYEVFWNILKNFLGDFFDDKSESNNFYSIVCFEMEQWKSN